MTYVSKPTTSSKHPGTSTNRPGTVSAHPSVSTGNHPASTTGPAVPTLTAPANNANVFNTIAVTVSATSTDGDLDRIDFVMDPGGSEVIVATDATAPYSQSWTPTGVTLGAHTLVARAVRGGQRTDSASITINVGEVLHNLVSSVTCLRNYQSDFGVNDAGGGACDSWTDCKNSVAATDAGTSTKRPAIVANAVGTRTALRYDGTSDVLRDATLNLAAPGTTPTFYWFIASASSWAATQTVVSAGTGGTVRVGQLTSTPNMAMSNAVNAPLNGGATIGTLVRGEARFNNNAADYLKLGSTSVTGTAGNTDPPAGLNIGAGTSAGGAGSSWAGDIFCVMVFSGIPSGAELAALSSAAAAMYPGVAT